MRERQKLLLFFRSMRIESVYRTRISDIVNICSTKSLNLPYQYIQYETDRKKKNVKFVTMHYQTVALYSSIRELIYT